MTIQNSMIVEALQCIPPPLQTQSRAETIFWRYSSRFTIRVCLAVIELPRWVTGEGHGNRTLRLTFEKSKLDMSRGAHIAARLRALSGLSATCTCVAEDGKFKNRGIFTYLLRRWCRIDERALRYFARHRIGQWSPISLRSYGIQGGVWSTPAMK